MRSDAEPEKTLPSPSTIVRRNNAYAHARVPPPVPVCAPFFFFGNARKRKSSRSAVLHYRTTAGPGSRSRPKGSKPGQRAKDPDPTHLTSTTVQDGEPGASHPQTTFPVGSPLWGPPCGVPPVGSPLWGPPCGVPPVGSPCGVPLWGPPVGSPCGVPLCDHILKSR